MGGGTLIGAHSGEVTCLEVVCLGCLLENEHGVTDISPSPPGWGGESPVWLADK